MFLSRWSDLVCKVGEFRLFEILKKRQFRQIQIRISRQPANFYRPFIWRWKALNLYYLHLQGYLLNPNTLLKICDQSRILALNTHSDIYTRWVFQNVPAYHLPYFFVEKSIWHDT